MVAEKSQPLDLQATHNCVSNVDSIMAPILVVSVLQELILRDCYNVLSALEISQQELTVPL